MFETSTKQITNFFVCKINQNLKYIQAFAHVLIFLPNLKAFQRKSVL